MPSPDDLERFYRNMEIELTPEQRKAKQELADFLKEKVDKLEAKKPILCLDFDGVCHSYTSGWKGADIIPDPPVDGLFGWLEMAREFFDIQIFSSRSNLPGGREAMWKWLCKYWTEYLFSKEPGLKEKYSGFEPIWLTLPTEKPAAFIGLDDRVLTFNGYFPDIDELINFKPWNKR